jgi:hypothetical protein
MLTSASEVAVPRTKSDLLVRGVLLRDVAALKRRVQALEKALWPSTRPASTTNSPRRHVIEVDAAQARRSAIDAFYKIDDEDWLRNNPQMLERRRERLQRLNAYLRERGFESEPE